MSRAQTALGPEQGTNDAGVVNVDPSLEGRVLTCTQCANALACVEQNRRLGTWVGSFICPHCRSEYLYAYRWGRLLRKA